MWKKVVVLLGLAANALPVVAGVKLALDPWFTPIGIALLAYAAIMLAMQLAPRRPALLKAAVLAINSLAVAWLLWKAVAEPPGRMWALYAAFACCLAASASVVVLPRRGSLREFLSRSR